MRNEVAEALGSGNTVFALVSLCVLACAMLVSGCGSRRDSARTALDTARDVVVEIDAQAAIHYASKAELALQQDPATAELTMAPLNRLELSIRLAAEAVYTAQRAIASGEEVPKERRRHAIACAVDAVAMAAAYSEELGRHEGAGRLRQAAGAIALAAGVDGSECT